MWRNLGLELSRTYLCSMLRVRDPHFLLHIKKNFKPFTNWKHFEHYYAIGVLGRRCDVRWYASRSVHRRAPRVSLEIPDGKLSTLAAVSFSDEGCCAKQHVPGHCSWHRERDTMSFSMKSSPAEQSKDYKGKITTERSFEYVLKSGLAGGLAGCAVSTAPCGLTICSRL